MSFCTEKSSATRVNFFTLSKARNSLLYCSISSPIFFFTLSLLSISSYEPETPLEPAHLVTESLSGTISATLYGLLSPKIITLVMKALSLRCSSSGAGTTYLPFSSLYCSLMRPVIHRKPSASTWPMSPVRNPPSGIITLSFSSGRLW